MTNGMNAWPWTGEDGSALGNTTRTQAADERAGHDAALLARAGAGLLALAFAIALLGPMIWAAAIALTLVAGFVLLGAAPFLAMARVRRSALVLPFPAEEDGIHVKRGRRDATEFLDR